MTDEPDDDRDLGELLRSLPATPASPGFTDRALARALAPPTWRSAGRRLLAPVGVPAAVAALLLVGVVTLRAQRERERRLETAETVAALQSEQLALATELALLRQIAAGQPALLRLGTADGFDVFLDLSPRPTASPLSPSRAPAVAYAGGPGTPPHPEVRPAVLRTVY